MSRRDLQRGDRGAKAGVAAIPASLEIVSIEVDQRELAGHEDARTEGEDHPTPNMSQSDSMKAAGHCLREEGNMA